MSRRANAAARCARCRMHESLCVCALVPRLVTRTRLVLVIHRYEDRKPTNTGRLAAECLVNSEVVVRGHASSHADTITIPAGTRPLLLFPHEGAISLDALPPSPEPATLIVPDGNWRQASKVRQRVEGLRDVTCVSLPRGVPSSYRLRFEAHDGGLATMEAIARAFAVLEGGAEGQQVATTLLDVFTAMVERTLWARGEIGEREMRFGVPEGALRHDPRSGVTGIPREQA